METPAVSQDQARKALDVEATLLRAIRATKQQEIAKRTGIAESSLSDWLATHRATMAKIIAATGFRLISPDRICVKRDEWLLLTKLASRALANEQCAQQLLFDDPE